MSNFEIVLNSLEDKFLDDKLLKDTHTSIQKYYFDKKDNYTRDDVDVVCLSLSKLGVSDTIVSGVKAILISKIVKKEKEAEQAKQKQERLELRAQEKAQREQASLVSGPIKLITDKDIRNVLQEYYDFDKEEAICY